jgi:hypothetical protein
MKKILTAALSAMMFLFVAGGAAIAQEEESDDTRALPVETWTCDFREGKGPADLDPVVDAWNEWMDSEGVDDYFAATILPQFYGELPFDIGWLGAWTDGHAMGKGTDQWVYDSGDLPGQFFEVFDCGSHTSFVSIRLREQADTGAEPDDHFVLNFSNCSFEEDGGGYEALMSAQAEWNAYSDEHGFVSSAWMWFPIAGEINEDYDFKYVVGTPDHTTSGANWQLFADGHWQKSEELFDEILDCDISRVYDGTVRWLFTAGD